MFVRDAITSTVRLLNQPVIKSNVKVVSSSFTFVFGLFEVYDLCNIALGRRISTECGVGWKNNTAKKVSILSAKISLVLSAGVSRPGVYLISNLAGTFFTTAQLEKVFGPNTIFEINPWHLRHVVSIVAVILALPSLVETTHRVLTCSYRIVRYGNGSRLGIDGPPWLTDNKVRLFNFFNTVTSRPVLHLGNELIKGLMKLSN